MVKPYDRTPENKLWVCHWSWGCDGSVLLNSTAKHQAEKDGPPNISLHAFYVIDHAKKALEAVCPGTVSCADIVALAARDAVHLSGGPTWVVPKGRKDGRISRASETRQLAAPTSNISQLEQSFSQQGLSMEDLVALSGIFQLYYTRIE
ncbi:putative peroxidase [Helianthus anomalus]